MLALAALALLAPALAATVESGSVRYVCLNFLSFNGKDTLVV
jgi:hypothetical protein